MRTEVKISDDFMVGGAAIWVSQVREGHSRLVLRLAPDGLPAQWEPAEPVSDISPTLRLNDEVARALLDALLRHYQGASDLHTVRADLLHERKRVDDLIASLGQLAIIQAQR